jgi:hypothetical protein
MALGCLGLVSDRDVALLLRRGHPRYRMLESAAVAFVQRGCSIKFTTSYVTTDQPWFIVMHSSWLIGYRPTPQTVPMPPTHGSEPKCQNP